MMPEGIVDIFGIVLNFIKSFVDIFKDLFDAIKGAVKKDDAETAG